MNEERVATECVVYESAITVPFGFVEGGAVRPR